MNKNILKNSLFLLIGLISLKPSIQAKDPLIKIKQNQYCFKKTDNIIIDGYLNEASWMHAPFSKNFSYADSSKPRKLRSNVQTAWDEKFFYVAFDTQDKDVYSTFLKRDQALYYQDIFEIFIKPLDAKERELKNTDKRLNHYIEIEVSPLGTILDGYFKKYRNKRSLKWDMKDLEVAARIKRKTKLNKVIDLGYVIEIKIPFKSLFYKPKKEYPIKKNTVLHLNFYQVDYKIPFRLGRIGKQAKEFAWIPPGQKDFHFPDNYRSLKLIDLKSSHKAKFLKKLLDEKK